MKPSWSHDSRYVFMLHVLERYLKPGDVAFVIYSVEIDLFIFRMSCISYSYSDSSISVNEFSK